MLFRALLFSCIPLYAVAEDRVQVSRSFISVVDAEPPAVATIIFENGQDNTITEEVTLTFDGLVYHITASLGVSSLVPDTIVVRVPEGYIAIPQELTVEDGSAGELLVYPLTAVGM